MNDPVEYFTIRMGNIEAHVDDECARALVSPELFFEQKVRDGLNQLLVSARAGTEEVPASFIAQIEALIRALND